MCDIVLRAPQSLVVFTNPEARDGVDVGIKSTFCFCAKHVFLKTIFQSFRKWPFFCGYIRLALPIYDFWSLKIITPLKTLRFGLCPPISLSLPSLFLSPSLPPLSSVSFLSVSFPSVSPFLCCFFPIPLWHPLAWYLFCFYFLILLFVLLLLF